MALKKLESKKPKAATKENAEAINVFHLSEPPCPVPEKLSLPRKPRKSTKKKITSSSEYEDESQSVSSQLTSEPSSPVPKKLSSPRKSPKKKIIISSEHENKDKSAVDQLTSDPPSPVPEILALPRKPRKSSKKKKASSSDCEDENHSVVRQPASEPPSPVPEKLSLPRKPRKSTKKKITSSSEYEDENQSISSQLASEPPSPVPGKLSLPRKPRKSTKKKITSSSEYEDENQSVNSQLSSEPVLQKSNSSQNNPKTKKRLNAEVKKPKHSNNVDRKSQSKEISSEPKKKPLPSKSHQKVEEEDLSETESSDDELISAQVEKPVIKKKIKASDIPRYFEENYKYLNHTFDKAKSRYIYDLEPTFSDSKQLYKLYNIDQTESYQVNLEAQIEGTFFKIDNAWTTYRRNYFCITSRFLLNEERFPEINIDKHCWLLKDGELEHVDSFSIGIRAQATNIRHEVIIHQYDTKRKVGNRIIPRPIAARPSGTESAIVFEPINHDVVFPRLIFSGSTNIHARIIPPHYSIEVVVNLYANIKGKSVLVANCFSTPICVRPQSPIKYKDDVLRKTTIAIKTLKNITPFYSSAIHPPIKEVKELYILDQLSFENHNIYAHSEIESCIEEARCDYRLADLNAKLYSMNKDKV